MCSSALQQEWRTLQKSRKRVQAELHHAEQVFEMRSEQLRNAKAELKTRRDEVMLRNARCGPCLPRALPQGVLALRARFILPPIPAGLLATLMRLRVVACNCFTCAYVGLIRESIAHTEQRRVESHRRDIGSANF